MALPRIASTGEEALIGTYDHYWKSLAAWLRTFHVGTHAPATTFMPVGLELEYGVKAWWTTELYWMPDDVHDSTVYWVSLGEPFPAVQREHFINPVLYIEYEQISEADRL